LLLLAGIAEVGGVAMLIAAKNARVAPGIKVTPLYRCWMQRFFAAAIDDH